MALGVKIVVLETIILEAMVTLKLTMVATLASTMASVESVVLAAIMED